MVPRTLHLVGLALGEKPNGTTRTSAKDSPSDATQTVDLNAEEHDRSYLYGDDEKPARSAQKSGGLFARLRGWLGIAPAASTDSSLDEYAGDEAFVSAVVDETHRRPRRCRYSRRTLLRILRRDPLSRSARRLAEPSVPSARSPQPGTGCTGRSAQGTSAQNSAYSSSPDLFDVEGIGMRPQPAWIRCSAPPWRTAVNRIPGEEPLFDVEAYGRIRRF